MSQVNLPFALAKFRPSGEFSFNQNAYFGELERVLQQLYDRTGGDVDLIEQQQQDAIDSGDVEANSVDISSNAAKIAMLQRQIDDLQAMIERPMTMPEARIQDMIEAEREILPKIQVVEHDIDIEVRSLLNKHSQRLDDIEASI